jgi:DNA-binding MarR family transcriptional regulator
MAMLRRVTGGSRRSTGQDPQALSDLEHEVARFLRRYRAAASLVAAELDPVLDFSGYLLAVAIAEGDRGDGVRATDLAEAFGVHKSTISRGLAQLEQVGLVERLRDEQDRRARRVHLTGDGSRRLWEVRQRRWDHFNAVISAWDPDDTRTLALLLGRLTDGLERPDA